MNAFLAELRVLGATSKEILEGIAKLHDRHLCRIFGNFQHPRELLTLDGIQLTAQRRLRWLGQVVVLLPCVILALPLGQRPVVSEPRRPGCLGENRSPVYYWAQARSYEQ